MYKFYTDLLPLPNSLSPDPKVEPNRDYTAYNSPYRENYNQFANRFDYNLSEKDRFFLRWNWSEWRNGTPGWLYLSSRPDLLTSESVRHNFGQGMDWVHTFSATTMLNVAVSSNIYRNDSLNPGFQTLRPSSVGLPSYMDVQASSSPALPNISWDGWAGVSSSNSVFRPRVLQARADITHTTASHTIKAGIDARGQFYTGYSPGNNAGTFAFTSTWTQRTDDGFNSVGTGNYAGPWAAFMLGLPASISAANNASQAFLNPYYAAFIQENWRVSRRLSLNFGLRMEYEFGPTDRYDRIIGVFDPAAQLPITGAAQAAYAVNPISQLPASQFKVLGGSVYPGAGGADRKLWKNVMLWQPRIAAAYQINSRTVLRVGTGLFYDTFNVMGLTGSGTTTPINQLGFSRSTSTTLSTDFGQTWLAGNPYNGVSPLTDPFPVRANGTRFDAPLGSALGAMAIAGSTYQYWPYERPHTRQVRWRLDVQRQVGSTMVLGVAYAGSYSDRVPIAKTITALPAEYWAYGTTRNNTVANAMNANVTNPFYIGNFASLQNSNPTLYQYMATNSFFSSRTIRTSQLLLPLPHLSGLTEQAPKGKVKTEELNVSFERRFSQGFNFNLAYTRLWNYAADYFPNQFDTSPAWEPSRIGAPHRLTATSVYQMPFGKGRRWLQSGPASWILGGFQLTAIFELQPEPLLTWSTTLFYTGDPSNACGGPRTLDQWFNTANFERNAALQAAAFQAAVFPREINGYGGCRLDRLNNWNLNGAREFKLRERATLALRFDVYNVQNRSQFGAPNTTPTSTDFGKVTSQPAGSGGGGGASNRWVTVQARLSF